MNLGPTRVCVNYESGMTTFFYGKVKFLFLMHLYWNILEMFIFSITFQAKIKILVRNVKTNESLVLYVSKHFLRNHWEFSVNNKI